MAEQLYHAADNIFAAWSILLDLRKAFDCIDHDILIHKLSQYRFHGAQLDLMKSYLSDRFQVVSVSNSMSQKSGSHMAYHMALVLGPTLFIIYINDIVNASSLNTTLFADDTHLHASVPDEDIA